MPSSPNPSRPKSSYQCKRKVHLNEESSIYVTVWNQNNQIVKNIRHRTSTICCLGIVGSWFDDGKLITTAFEQNLLILPKSLYFKAKKRRQQPNNPAFIDPENFQIYQIISPSMICF